MKKIFTVILGIILCVSMAGCSQPTLTLKATWSNQTLHYEKTEYTISRKDKNNVEIATGKLTYIIDAVSDTQSGDDTETEIYKLSMSTVLNFTDGKTDRIDSVSYFTKYGLNPIRTEKSEIKESTADYNMFKIGPEHNYSYKGNYIDYIIDGTEYKKGAAANLYTGSEDEKDITMNMSKRGSKTADNEYVFYFIRAIEELAAGYSISFSLSNIYSSLTLTSPALKTTTMSLSVADGTTGIEVAPSIVSAAGSSVQFAGTDSKITSMKATLAISGQRTGSSITIYYSTPLKDDTASFVPNNRKVMTGLDTVERDPTSGEILYSMNYRLSDYSRTAI